MILAAGLTPAWQQILEFNNLELGEVNRAQKTYWCASGKVLNVAWGAARLGAETAVLSVLGGETGAQIQREFSAAKIQTDWVFTKSPTRVCTTLINRHASQVTELVENASAISSSILSEFSDRFAAAAEQADVIVLSGSLPVETPASYYRDLLQQDSVSRTGSRGARRPVVLDARGPELLAALECRPFLVKPNREELARTVGYPINGDSDMVRAMTELLDSGAEWVLITDGPRPLWLASKTERFRIVPPTRDVVNPIGSGDSLAAGIAVGLSEGETLLEAVRLGVAAAGLNVECLLPAMFDESAARNLAKQVTITHDQ